jgi:hypothetical protein
MFRRATILGLFFLIGLTWPLNAGDVQKGNFGGAKSGESQKSEKPEKPNQAATGRKRNSYPFSGELETRDEKAITLKGKKKSRVLLLSSETRILRNGSKVKLSEAQPGEQVSGSARKNAEGKEEAMTVNLKGTKASEK